MKTVFMGTPDFSVPVLSAMIKDGQEVGYVITQPDKARNRGKKVQFTPVKELAVSHNIEVLQPVKIRQDQEVFEKLKEYQPDIIVVVAYGQIIPKEILELPKYGCVNVHASLLPKLRGASPVQHAILQGEEETGITIMQMNEGLDTGDMLAKESLKIGSMNGEELHDALSEMGAELLIRTLPLIEAGKIIPEKQDDSLSTYAGLISKQDGKIDFTASPVEIERQIRAFDPWPGAFCSYGDGQMKVWKAEPVSADVSGRNPGEILSAEDRGLDVVCGDGILRITEIQMPGKKRVSVRDYLRGNRFDKLLK